MLKRARQQDVYDDKVPDPREHPRGVGTTGQELSKPDSKVEPPTELVTDLYGGIYPRDYPRHGPNGGTQAVAQPQGQIVVPQVAKTVLASDLPAWFREGRFSRSRSPDGGDIYGAILPANQVQQICPRKIGRKWAYIYNVGSSAFGSNGAYLCTTYNHAVDFLGTADYPINGFPLPVSTLGGIEFKWESEAPLFAVSASGTLLVIVANYWRNDARHTGGQEQLHGG
jgi:hypothetical protein